MIGNLNRTERTGQQVHDSVWKTFIFAKMFTKEKIFVNIFAKSLEYYYFRETKIS